jgi:pyruvate dehydrogenase E2 component (dihydrolipoamide acetyltransferase)
VTETTLTLPDLGGATDAMVIEVLVKAGDTIQIDDPIITLEGDKATMEVPATHAGTIKSLKIKVGDKLSEGDPLLVLNAVEQGIKDTEKDSNTTHENDPNSEPKNTISISKEMVLTIPDLGTPDPVTVIDIAIKPGDTIQQEQTVMTLEGDKASMDIPATHTGQIKEILIKLNDQVTSDTPFATLITDESINETITANPPQATNQTNAHEHESSEDLPLTAPLLEESGDQYAGPGARRLARALGITLTSLNGSGHKGRITSRDVEAHVKQQLQKQQSPQSSVLGLQPAKPIDFNRFGKFEQQPLSRIKQQSGQHLHRNWVSIPHVTQHGDAEITLMDAYRKRHKAVAAEHGIKLTPLAFIMKAVVSSLKHFPQFNSSLDQSGQNLIVKHYYHIGVAVDTPQGLVVPVIRDVDKKNIVILAKELAGISEKARDGQLKPADMQGSCFTISSLGGIGGHYFTPIINAPDVAILGISKAYMKPVFDSEKSSFDAKLHLPLSLSYDHRVIDGAQGARFFVHLCEQLKEFDTMTFTDMLDSSDATT